MFSTTSPPTAASAHGLSAGRVLSLALYVLTMVSRVSTAQAGEPEPEYEWVCHGNKMLWGKNNTPNRNNAYTKKLWPTAWNDRKDVATRYPDTYPDTTVKFSRKTDEEMECAVDGDCNIECSGETNRIIEKIAICKPTSNTRLSGDYPFIKMLVNANSKDDPVPGEEVDEPDAAPVLPGKIIGAVCTLDDRCRVGCNGSGMGDPHIQVRRMRKASIVK